MVVCPYRPYPGERVEVNSPYFFFEKTNTNVTKNVMIQKPQPKKNPGYTPVL